MSTRGAVVTVMKMRRVTLIVTSCIRCPYAYDERTTNPDGSLSCARVTPRHPVADDGVAPIPDWCPFPRVTE